MPRSWNQISNVIALIAEASTADDSLLRAFFQLNDDLAEFPGLTSLGAGDVTFPTDSSRAALVAAILAFRFQEKGQPPPEWLRDTKLVAAQPVFLIDGFHDLVRAQTPEVLADYNVFVDRDSLTSA